MELVDNTEPQLISDTGLLDVSGTNNLAIIMADVIQEPLVAGNRFQIEYLIENTELEDIDGFEVGFYISPDREITTADKLLGKTTIDSLAGGENTDILTQRLKLPKANDKFWDGSDNYYIGVIVDRQNSIVETNENDNVSWDRVEINLPAELSATSFNLPTNLDLGEQFQARFKVKNSGAENAGKFRVGFYISEDNNITTDDIFIGSKNINKLNSGKISKNLRANLTLPQANSSFWKPNQDYYIGMIVDDRNVIIESNENNNSSFQKVNIGKDLSANWLNIVNKPLAPGERFTLEYLISNLSNLDVEKSEVGFYLSKDQNITNQDILLDKTTIAALQAGKDTGIATHNLTLPNANNNFWKGLDQFYIGMIVDNKEQIIEINENNNIAWEQVNLELPVDLVVQTFNVVQNQAFIGDQIKVNYKITNNGIGDANKFQVGFYLSEDNQITSDDIFLGNVNINSLKAGATTKNLNKQFKLPSVENGFWRFNQQEYYIGAIVDYQNVIIESNEGNNTKSELVKIVNPEPGENFDRALDVGNLNKPFVYSEFIGDSDPSDYYKFSLTTVSEFTASVTNASASPNRLEMYLVHDSNNNGIWDDGEDITYSSINLTGTINIDLGAGNYFLAIQKYVFDEDANSNYNLRLSANKVDLTPSNDPGSKFDTAFNVGTLNAAKEYQQFVGTVDPSDYYKFSLATVSEFTASVTNASDPPNRLEMYLIQDTNNNGIWDEDEDIAYNSINGSTILNRQLGAGTYFIAIQQYVFDEQANSTYDLILKTS